MGDTYILLEDGPNGEAKAFANPEGLICAWNSDDVGNAFDEMERALSLIHI